MEVNPSGQRKANKAGRKKQATKKHTKKPAKPLDIELIRTLFRGKARELALRLAAGIDLTGPELDKFEKASQKLMSQLVKKAAAKKK